ncbi:MAG TPA: sigma-70 family RNA polymerase sigma factor [Steroidobacteraceae bacterium]|nr:sigma-70 family RNA polymerase sigma factor [Steroidobacteraceae bacterium]
MESKAVCNPGAQAAPALQWRPCARHGHGGEPIACLHERFREPLRRYFARYRLNSHDIEDLTQEVFLRLARPGHREALRQPDAFLFTLARNLVRDRARRLRTRATESALALDDLDLPCGSPSLEESVENDERLRRADTALDTLRAEARKAFIMHRVLGCSYAEIALDLGVSVSMIEKHMMSAIAALRDLTRPAGHEVVAAREHGGPLGAGPAGAD